MADQKISALTSASTPLAGTEVLPIVQSSTTKKVSVADLTIGRTVNTGNLNVSGDQTITGAVRALLKLYGDYAGGTDVGKVQFFNAVDEFLAQININNTTGAAGDTSNMELWVSAAGVAKKVITLQSTQDVDIAAGNLVPKTAAKGINFTANTPAAGMTSQLLNWYEEGAFTPALTFGGNSVGIGYAGQYGYYTRVGRQVFYYVSIALNNKGSSAGDAVITGLPFAASSGTALFPDGIVRAATALTFTAPIYAPVLRTTSTIALLNNSGGTQAALTDAAFANNTEISITGFYFV